MVLHHVVVDGSNIATEGREAPSLSQLDAAVQAFIREYQPQIVTVVVDATFPNRIDRSERQTYEDATVAGELITPPAGAVGRGDAFVLQIADRAGATVLSNDSFQEFHGTYDWLFDDGRLIGGKPVPHVGWVFMPRTPVRGPASRRAISAAKRAQLAARRGRDGSDEDVTAGKPAKAGGGAGDAAIAAPAKPTKASKPTRTRKGVDGGRAAKAGKTAATVAPGTVETSMAQTRGGTGQDVGAGQPAAATEATKAVKVDGARTSAKARRSNRAGQPAALDQPGNVAEGSAAAKAVKASKATRATRTAKARPSKASKAEATQADQTDTAPRAAKVAKARSAPKAGKAGKAGKGSKADQPGKAPKAGKATKARDAAKAAKPTKGVNAEKAAKRSAAGAPSPSTAAGQRPAEPAVFYNEALPFIEFVGTHPVGSRVEAVVEEFSSHGAYVRVDGGVRGYVPLKYLADPAPRSARAVLRAGESRHFVVVEVDAARRGVDLALPGVVSDAGAGGATSTPPVEASAPRREEAAGGRGTRKGKAQIRVHELARELGLTNKRCLDLCLALGIRVKTHSSGISDADAERVRQHVGGDGSADRRPERSAAEQGSGGKKGAGSMLRRVLRRQLA